MPKNSFVTDPIITGKPPGGLYGHVACEHTTAATSWYQDGTVVSTSDSDNVYQDGASTIISHFRINDMDRYNNAEYNCRVDGGETVYIGVFLKSGGEFGILFL